MSKIHIIRNEDWYVVVVQGVDYKPACEDASLLASFGNALDLALTNGLLNIGFNFGALRLRSDLRNKRMLRRQNKKCHPKDRIWAGGKYGNNLAILRSKIDLASL